MISNKKRTIFLRRLFFLVNLGLAAAALIFFLADMFLIGLIIVGVFGLWYLYFLIADYQYIEFKIENNRVLLNYHKAVKIGSVEFNAIEFPQSLLHHYRFESSIFGKNSDLTLIIRTNRGIASYPTISLTALSTEDRIAVKRALSDILRI